MIQLSYDLYGEKGRIQRKDLPSVYLSVHHLINFRSRSLHRWQYQDGSLFFCWVETVCYYVTELCSLGRGIRNMQNTSQ